MHFSELILVVKRRMTVLLLKIWWTLRKSSWISVVCALQESLMMKPGQNQVLYALYGVVEHSGTLHGGHYVAYVKVSLLS
jgi:ubiquitin C-terminal hydrolase